MIQVIKKQQISFFFSLLLLIIIILLPRLLSLDSGVTPDEPKWLARSGNFYYALRQGDFWSTFQSVQPGVTVMSAGAAAFMWRYPAYTQEVSGYFGWQKEIEPFLLASGHEPLDLLMAGRLFIVILNTSLLVGAFLVARQLLGWWPAFASFLVIALDPFHTALSRMLDLDGLMASFMFLSLLTFLNYNRTERRINLLLSGIAAGLAWLTKASALFLIPFMALILFALSDKKGDEYSRRKSSQILIAWCFVGLVTSLLFWPALLVNPIDTIRTQLFSFTIGLDGNDYHHFPEADKYGFFFYPITYLWRTTPTVMLGLLFALVAYLKRYPPFHKAQTAHIRTVLVIFALLFELFIGLWDTKTDRYLIPSYLPLDMVAALGWIAVGQAMAKQLKKGWLVQAIPVAGIIVQALMIVTVFPHFMTAYNPLLGGGSVASKIMTLGWGEGLGEAARYLNNKPQSESLRVVSLSHQNYFSYFFKGQPVSYSFEGLDGLSNWFKTDDMVLYIQQPQWLNKDLFESLAQQRPEQVIKLNRIDYAKIYNLHHLAPPIFLRRGQPRFTDWSGAIRLLGYDLGSEPFAPGDSFRLFFYLENLAELTKNLSTLVRLVDQNGNELLRDEGWPLGSPTSEWKLHEIWRDGHELTIPIDAEEGYYQIFFSFYDPKTLDSLPATNTLTNEPLGDELLVDYLYVGEFPALPIDTLPIELGGEMRLLGAKIGQGEGVAKASGTVDLSLFWQPEGSITQDVTLFIHLVGPNGLVAQVDKPPTVPIGLWRPNEVMVEQARLSIPSDTPPGSYELRVGMYDPITLQRLPVSENGQVISDYVNVGSVRVESSDSVSEHE